MSESYCPLPWVQQAVRTNGDYRICSQAVKPYEGLLRNSDGQVMNIRQNSPSEARESALLRQTRLDMLAGRWPLPCQRCRGEEAAGLRSRRQLEGDRFKEFDADWARRVTDVNGKISAEAEGTRSFDLRMGNQCTLRCRMCGPDNSSALADLLPSAKSGSLSWPLEKVPWEHMMDVIPKLTYLQLDGGEPLIIEAHYDFLEKIVQSGQAASLTLEYKTSLNHLPERALELWKHFGCVRLGISIDGFGAVNEYIRPPSKWSDVAANLRRLDQATGKFQIWIATAVQIYNILNLPILYRRLLYSDVKILRDAAPSALLGGRLLSRPSRLSLRAMPKNLKDYVEERLMKSARDLGDRSQEVEEIFSKYVLFMRSKDESDAWLSFLDFTRSMDQRAKVSFLDLYPELYTMNAFAPLIRRDRALTENSP